MKLFVREMMRTSIAPIILVIAGFATAATASADMILQIDIMGRGGSSSAAGWQTIGTSASGWDDGATHDLLLANTTTDSGVDMVFTGGSPYWWHEAADSYEGVFDGTDFNNVANDCFIYQAGSSGIGTVTFSNLDPTKNYKFEVCSTISGTGTAIADWQVQGDGAATYGDGNIGYQFDSKSDGFVDGTLMIWSSVKPTAAGVITLSVTNGAAIPLNAIRVTELVPEPASIALLGIGGAMVLIHRRKNH